ncbi:MAG: FAD-dependent oxidoreductase [Planctomycetales bacterium]|nr:FAD-dependent oxidoreductase [Planctomycetales bacterium]
MLGNQPTPRLASRPCRLSVIAALIATSFTAPPLGAANVNSAERAETYDVVIYGGTSAGVIAAVQTRKMGGRPLIIEPTRRLGGLTTGGLGQTDIGNKAAVGGLSRDFYRRVRNFYADPTHWKWQQREDYRSGGQSATAAHEDTMWTFEPSAALSIMQDLVREFDAPVAYEERLDRTPLETGSTRVAGVVREGAHIVALRMESGREFRGRVFIDATYEGDLLAGAGVDYVVGRESNARHDETLNGVATRYAAHHQLKKGIDPYVIRGDSASGLLPQIDPTGPGEEGAADSRVQAYCFRMCLTDHPDNRLPIEKPEGYDPLQYELLLRNFEAGADVLPWSFSDMPNRKTDINNNRGASSDFIGRSYEYPEASYQRRAAIEQEHRIYQQGFLWTLANHPRVPEAMRREVLRWGPCRDEFERADGWQRQLYVREARRMIGAYVMTQHECEGRRIASRPVALAAYTMDSHHVQRYVNADGHVQNEGDVQIGGFAPYPIDYGSVTPRREQCDNLLVPVCLSASHIAYGSIRMEPVFMALGQATATAAMLAIKNDVAVQDVPYPDLREKLLADEQRLEWTGPTPRRASVDSLTLPGNVVDDEAADRDGFDAVSRSLGPFINSGYRHDDNRDKGAQRARFRFVIEEAGSYAVRIAWTASSNRATNVPVRVSWGERTESLAVNQRQAPSHGAFGTLGTWHFPAGEAFVEVSNAQTDGHVVVDAVQFERAEDPRPLEE